MSRRKEPAIKMPPPPVCCCDHKAEGWVDAGCKIHGLSVILENQLTSTRGDSIMRLRNNRGKGKSWRVRPAATLEWLDALDKDQFTGVLGFAQWKGSRRRDYVS